MLTSVWQSDEAISSLNGAGEEKDAIPLLLLNTFVFTNPSNRINRITKDPPPVAAAEIDIHLHAVNAWFFRQIRQNFPVPNLVHHLPILQQPDVRSDRRPHLESQA